MESPQHAVMCVWMCVGVQRLCPAQRVGSRCDGTWVGRAFHTTCQALAAMSTNEYQPAARMTVDEKNMVRRLHFEEGKSRTEIAKLLKRTLSSVSRLLAQKKAPRVVGRPVALSSAKVDAAAALLDKMVDEADGDYEVTLAMLRRRGRFKVSERTLASAIRSCGFSFKSMRQKPILTQGDIKER